MYEFIRFFKKGNELNVSIVILNNINSHMDAYCKATGEDRNSMYFMYKGREVLETDTPKTIGFVEGDTIEVYDLKAYLL